MANLEGKRGGIGGRTRSQDHIVEKIEPSAAWTYDAENHYLLVDLPDFKKEEVRLEVDDTNQINVSGERLGKDKDKYFYFEKTFKLPGNSDFDNITGKFDGEILCVTVPKQVPDKSKEVSQYNEDINHEHIINNSGGFTTNYNNPQTNPPSKEEIIGSGIRPSEDNNNNNNNHNNSNYYNDNGKRKLVIDEFDREKLRRWANENITPFGRAIEVIKRNSGILITALLAFSIGVLVSRGIDSSPGRLG